MTERRELWILSASPDLILLRWMQSPCVIFRRPTSLRIKLTMRSFNLTATFVFGKHADMGKPSSSPVSSGSMGSGYTLLVLKSLLSPAEKPHDLPTLLLWLLSTFFLGYALGQSLEDEDPEVIMHI